MTQFLKQNNRYLFSAMAVLLLSSLSAHAATVAVGTCRSGLVQFSTIQDAIDHSPAGTTIDVCPGTYPEQLTITKKYTLQGVSSSGQDAAVIVPPVGGMAQNATDVDGGGAIAAQIFVQNATGVILTNLTVDGANNGITGCAPDLQGVLFQNASGTMTHMTVRNQYLSPSLNGCQSGEGIFVETGSGSSSSVDVETSSVHDYQKNGITGNDAGTTLTVNKSRVRGFGVVQPPAAAQNGIQLAYGAQGTITGNLVTDDVYGDINVAIATGILLYDAAENANILLKSNTVGNTQGAAVIYVDQANSGLLGDGVSVISNNFFGTVNYDAIDVCTNGNTIMNNAVYDSAQSAVHLDASCSGTNPTGNGNTVNGNGITDSGCAGVLIDSGTSGNNPKPNIDYDVPFTSLTGTCPATPAKHGKLGVRGKIPYSPKGKK